MRRDALLQRLLDEGDLAPEPRVLGVLVGVHRAAEDHHGVPARRIAGRGVAVRDDPAVEVVAPLDDDALEEPAATRDGRVVDDREDAHPATVARAPAADGQNSVSSVGGGSTPPAAGTPASSSSPRRICALRGREVVAVVVEHRVDLLRLVGEPRERLDPLGELLLASRASRSGRRRSPPRGCSRSARSSRGSGRRRRGGSPRRPAARRSRRACAGCRATRTRGRAARGTRACRPARPRPSTSDAGTRSAGRAARAAPARGRAPPSPPSDFTNRGWYWSSTPRSFPESSSGSSAARNSRNAASVGSPSCHVIAADALTWNVNASGVRRAQRSVTAGSGSA